MGRPPSRSITLRDGFYIQVRNKGAGSGIKIRSTDSKSMMDAAAEYMKSKEKEVLVLGELKKGVWLNEQAAADKEKKEKKENKAKAQSDIKEKANAKVSPKTKTKGKAKGK